MFALDYRPRSLSDLLGQNQVTIVLDALLSGWSSGCLELPVALLFTGTWGVGKTSAARIVAAYLNCVDGADVRPCGTCSSCVAIFSNNSTAVIEISAATNGSVADIEYLGNTA